MPCVGLSCGSTLIRSPPDHPLIRKRGAATTAAPLLPTPQPGYSPSVHRPVPLEPNTQHPASVHIARSCRPRPASGPPVLQHPVESTPALATGFGVNDQRKSHLSAGFSQCQNVLDLRFYRGEMTHAFLLFVVFFAFQRRSSLTRILNIQSPVLTK